ncbi:plasmid SOS inhibition protein A [Escherichia coli]
MSVRSQALVPLSTEQQAAWRAVAETEKRRHQGNTLAEYPYAGAFFRCLNGSRRISLSDLRFFMPSLTAEELHGNRLQWLYAIDVLIETQGEVCLLPLPGDAAERLFPSVRFRVRERSRHKSALVMQKYSRQQWQDMPFWQVIAEASLAAREAGHAVREMERWMVPNKLREAA